MTDTPAEVRKLTPEELAEQAEYAKNAYQRECDFVTAQRLHAYQNESDPIYMEAQRDSTRTVEEWQAKVDEIKERYPYPPQPK